MPATVAPPIGSAAPPHKLWTREECAVLERAGVLEKGRYELIGGELTLKMGKKIPHMQAVMRLVSWLRSVYGEPFVAQEPSIRLHPEDTPRNEPEPDAIVLERSFLDLAAQPEPKDIRMAAEVSSTSLSFDLTVKARLYARAGIAEYWVLDLEGRRIIVHRNPGQGLYQEAVAYLEDEVVATLGAPEAGIRVGDLL